MRRPYVAVVAVVMACAWANAARAQTRPAPSSSVTPVTVEQLVAVALERSPRLQAQRLASDRARAEEQQAGLRANPMLSTDAREEVGGPGRSNSVMVQWPLELFRRTARVEVARRDVAVAEADIAEAERELVADVRRQSVALVAARRRLAVTDETAASLRATYELLAGRVSEGASAPLLRDQAFVEWQRVEAQRPRRRADVTAARSALAALVGLDADAPLEIADDLPHLGQQPVPDSIGPRPDVRQADARAAWATATADRARQNGRFDLGVSGGYMRSANGFPQLGLSPTGAPTPIRGVFHTLSLGLSVTLPIADRNQGGVAAALADVNAARFRAAQARLNASADIAAARARDDESQAAVRVYTDGLRRAARHNLDVVRESFSLGRMTLADVFAEERRVLDVEMGYVDALNDAALARTNLLFALGVSR